MRSLKIFIMTLAMAATAGLALVVPAVAAADPASDYLGRVKEQLPDVYQQFGPEALLAEGYKVCAYMKTGLDGATQTRHVEDDLGLPYESAMSLAVFANVRLCGG